MIDAGPLIHLDQIGQINLLKRFPTLFIPSSVMIEIKHDTNSPDLKAIKKWANIKITHAPKSFPGSVDSLVKKFSLQIGEIDCIQLAWDIQPCIFLTDDLSARSAAEKLSIEVHGTVGIIAYAFRQKWLSLARAEDALNRLYHESNLFITYTIIEEALQRLRKSI